MSYLFSSPPSARKDVRTNHAPLVDEGFSIASLRASCQCAHAAGMESMHGCKPPNAQKKLVFALLLHACVWEREVLPSAKLFL
jgi:hypothetical protein